MNRVMRRAYQHVDRKLEKWGMNPTPYKQEDLLAAALLAPLMFDDEGNLRILPADKLGEIPTKTLHALGYLTGTYMFPSIELVAWIQKNVIRGRNAIEIGAGHGALGRALGIPRTDSYHRKMSDVEPILYESDVEHLSAEDAIKKYKPKVVVGAWITHRFAPGPKPPKVGNDYGPNFRKIMRSGINDYLLIGNAHAHAHADGMQPEWRVRRTYLPVIFSRSLYPALDCAYWWQK